MTDPFLMLFVPADRPERFAKAATAGADAIIIDLEDSIAESGKDAARRKLISQLQETALVGSVYVRVNAADTRFFQEDIAAVAALDIEGIVLPKAEFSAGIEDLRARLPNFQIYAIIESARGVGHAREIARWADRIMFGSLDYALSIGAEHQRDALLHVRSELVLATALAGVRPPIDGVTPAVDDAAAVEDDAAYASGLGFRGKLLIHPKQIAPAIRGFAPRDEAVAKARKIVAASRGEAVKLDGRMVDTPVVEAAHRLLRRHERAEARLAALGSG